MNTPITVELKKVIDGLKKIRKEVWGNTKCHLPIDTEIQLLEDVVIHLDPEWNGSHPIGMT